MKTKQLGLAAVIISASVTPAMYAVSQITGQILKHYNPDGVNINFGLAYLGQTVTAAGLTGLVYIVTALFLAWSAYKNDEQRSLARLAFAILGLQLVVFGLVAIAKVLFPVA